MTVPATTDDIPVKKFTARVEVEVLALKDDENVKVTEVSITACQKPGICKIFIYTNVINGTPFVNNVNNAEE